MERNTCRESIFCSSVQRFFCPVSLHCPLPSPKPLRFPPNLYTRRSERDSPNHPSPAPSRLLVVNCPIQGKVNFAASLRLTNDVTRNEHFLTPAPERGMILLPHHSPLYPVRETISPGHRPPRDPRDTLLLSPRREQRVGIRDWRFRSLPDRNTARPGRR